MRKINVRSAKFITIAMVACLLVFILAYAALTTNKSDKQSLLGYTQQAKSASVKEYISHDVDNAVLATSELKTGAGGVSYGDEGVVRGLPSEQGAPDQILANASASEVGLERLNIPDFNEKIIRTANLELQVKKGRFDYSYERAVAVARDTAGYVSQSKSLATGNNIASGEMVMRIPARDFDAVILRLKRLGKVKSLDISSEDVSEEYVDLKSRLKHWRSQEVVMLDLMGKAKSISESITIQNSLSQIQMEIERISGRLKFLEDRTSYATIRLFMAEPQVVVRADKWGLESAVRNAVHASARIVGSLIVLVGYLLPLVLLAGIGYALYQSIWNLRSNA